MWLYVGCSDYLLVIQIWKCTWSSLELHGSHGWSFELADTPVKQIKRIKSQRDKVRGSGLVFVGDWFGFWVVVLWWLFGGWWFVKKEEQLTLWRWTYGGDGLVVLRRRRQRKFLYKFKWMISPMRLEIKWLGFSDKEDIIIREF